MGIVKNHRRPKVDSGSESDGEPRNRTKYFKARDKARELQRQKGIYVYRSLFKNEIYINSRFVL